MSNHVRAVFSPTCRALTGRWFRITVLITALSLWIGLGDDTYWMLRGEAYAPETVPLILTALLGEGAVLSLPVLSALPAAAQAYTELATGAARAMIFRAGRRAWRQGKLCGCMASAFFSQLAGVLLFSLVLGIAARLNAGAVPGVRLLAALLPPVTARCLAGMVFSLFGALMALASGTAAAAYFAPLAACFTLKLLGSRFFVDVHYIDPADWLTGEGRAMWLLLGLTALTAVGCALMLAKEMRRHE